MNCKELEDKLSLYLYEELSPDEQAAAAVHLAACSRCRAALEKTRRVHEMLTQRQTPEVTPQLLAECRLALDRALDRELASFSWRRLLVEGISALTASQAFRASTVLALLVLSFNLGWTLRSRTGSAPVPSPGVDTSSFIPLSLQDARIRGITNVVPGAQTGEVRITLDAERRVTLEGSLDDSRIQQLLLYAVKTYDNPGIRRDTLDALRSRAENPNVRQALLYAMQHDSNPGVRLEALEAAQGLTWGPDVRGTFLGVVEHDENPGVRVAAIDVLVKHDDEEVLPTFERLAATDPNRYVRLKCASVIRNREKDGF